MLAFLPVIFTSFAAFGSAAPIPDPSPVAAPAPAYSNPPNGGILGEIVDVLERAHHDIDSLIPNITEVVHAKDPIQGLEYLVHVFEHDLVSTTNFLIREIPGDIHTIENVSHDLIPKIETAAKDFLDVSTKVAELLLKTGASLGSGTSEVLEGALKVMDGFYKVGKHAADVFLFVLNLIPK